MRGVLAIVATAAALFAAAPPAAAVRPLGSRGLAKALRADMRRAGRSSGASVVDLSTGQTLFSSAASVGRLPASVEKLYTTSTALERYGPDARLTTSVLGVGALDSVGGWHGQIFLKGGGDPTLGSQSFDRFAYGSGATMQQLATNLIAATGLTSIHGAIVGDESYFDSLRGTDPYGFHASTDIEGVLSALSFDRGLADEQGTAFQKHPALFAAQQFAAALGTAGVDVSGARVYTGVAPAGAQSLAAVHSPRIAWLIRLTNTPSDNFLAEMLLKGLGASFGAAGTTAAGAAVVRAQMQSSFAITPQIDDGSGLSRTDSTSPRQVVTLLRALATNQDFTSSLAVAGESGTMAAGLRGSPAQGRCRGKTGTLHDVANLVGYCTSHDGHTLAFAFLMNAVDPVAGHALEDQMAIALSSYRG